MTYRDFLSKHLPLHRRPVVSEEEFISDIEPPLTYAKVRTEAHIVLVDPGACDVSKGLAAVLLTLLDERRLRK